MSEIKINLNEVATELAHAATRGVMISDGSIIEDADMWREDGAGVLIYTEEAQDVFNVWYDYFYNFIDNHKL